MRESKIDTVTIQSWNDLQDAVYNDSWQAGLKRFRSPFAFRGMPDFEHRLNTSLSRIGGNPDEKEKHLLRNFRKYASRNFVEHDSAWDWLALAKHHGLPTRLLDWSFSPFVAMHFATHDLEEYDCDAVIWMVNYNQVHTHLPKPLIKELDGEGSVVYTVEMLSAVVKGLGELHRLSDQPFMLFFEPPSLDDRIVNQYALFSMMSHAAAVHDDWLERHPDLVKRVIIPAALKWEVRDRLDQANITERVLFPGLDGLSAWLKRHYKSRRNASE